MVCLPSGKLGAPATVGSDSTEGDEEQLLGDAAEHCRAFWYRTHWLRACSSPWSRLEAGIMVTSNTPELYQHSFCHPQLAPAKQL